MTWTLADEFLFSIKMGLRKGLALVRGMKRALTDEEQELVSRKIAEQVRYGWKIKQIEVPVAPGLHSKTGERKPNETE
jgi:hypothetical protein